jgi:N-methylhydantoinase B
VSTSAEPVQGATVSDPVTFEVLRNGFRAACSEGSTVIERVAYHPVITEGHDYSVSLLTADGRMVGNGYKDQTPHFGTFEHTVRAVLEDFPSSVLRRGDVYVINDPHRAGTHTLDVRFVRPVFYEGELIAFAVALCHWADIGGVMPGTFYPKATECYAEGLHLPPLRIYANDEPIPEIFRLIELNVRTPWDRIGDMQAQYHACRIMEKRLLEYCEKFGKDVVLLTFEEVMDRSERIFREEVAALPDGSFEFVEYIDHDEGKEGGPPVKVHLEMRIQGDRVTLDFTGSEAMIGPSGVSYPALLSASFDGTLHCFPHLAPLNHGIIRAIEFKTTPGTVVDVRRPTPCAAYCAGAYEKVDACVMACWAQAFATSDPNRVYAGTVNLQNCTLGGTHPTTNLPYVSYIWIEGGQGARADSDGASGLMMLFVSSAGNQPIEIHERWYPWLYTNCELVTDSCGDGRYRGGFGAMRNWLVQGESTLNVHGDRTDHGPYSLAGGTNGGPNQLILNRDRADRRDLGMYASGITLRPGDHLTFQANGGGGFGNPLERDPEAVVEDYADGLISERKAREVYGVAVKVIDEDAAEYSHDPRETERLRAELAKRSTTVGFAPWEVNPYGLRVTEEMVARGSRPDSDA